jgi:EAL domain-containing protein (putative c-di-GMP-specific phosphodiesterase class I)
MTVPIPSTLDELLTPDWLTAALGTRFPGIRVTRVVPGEVISRVATNARFTIECAGGLPEGKLYFLNVEPMSVTDPQLRDDTLGDLMARASLSADRVVLEITERHAIEDFAVARGALEYLRALGFSVAVDDAGSGFCSFQCLAEIRPEWLKLDCSLVRGIETDEVRQQLIKSLVDYGAQLGVSLVAEGIETETELTAVRALGVEFGQGFLFSRPVAPFPADGDYDWSALR